MEDNPNEDIKCSYENTDQNTVPRLTISTSENLEVDLLETSQEDTLIMEKLDGEFIMIESFTPVDLKTFERKKVSEVRKSLNISVICRFKT